MSILWIVIALLLAGVVIFAASLRTRRLLPAIELPAGESMPWTPMQRYAGITLIIVATLCAAAAAVVVWFGPAYWWNTDSVRLTFTALLIGALLSYLGFMILVRGLEVREDGSFDERDQVILGRSCAGVGGAMMATLAVWMVALTETYHAVGQIPSYFLYLVFWSCVMVNVLASLAGIVLSVRQS